MGHPHFSWELHFHLALALLVNITRSVWFFSFGHVRHGYLSLWDSVTESVSSNGGD